MIDAKFSGAPFNERQRQCTAGLADANGTFRLGKRETVGLGNVFMLIFHA